ncbi:MAG: PD40 domain-containing protein [Verrucomicrobia bacterium]|nr:PD40 domain-containing protein [Verrucomicrobiota bacterium]
MSVERSALGIERSAPRGAVFLSYASQDAEAAKRVAEALRTGGIEVWLDQEGGLVGGDAWDKKIREQINACVLFVPIISANTQARKEGYFRLEWHLAEERVRLIAKGVPFIVPVSVDATVERGALVPDAFLAVQWTRLPGGEAPAAFVERVRKLLGAEVAPIASAAGASLDDARGRGPAAPLPVAVQNSELSTVVRPATDAAFETFERQRPLWRRALPVVSAVLVTALVAGVVAWRVWPAPAPVTRFNFRLPEGQTFRVAARHLIAVSPDGRAIVYHATAGLHLRKLDELEAHPIRGTEGTMNNLCFAPDGQSVGYWQAGQLKRITAKGGAPVVICAVASTPVGVSWAPDGTILFGQREGILRVPATGGTPAVVVPSQNGESLVSPQLLADRDTVLFSARPAGSASVDGARIVAQKISTGARTVLVEGGVDARYLPTGHLVYVAGNVLMGVAFDARRLAVTGGAVPVVQGVMRTSGTVIDLANYGVGADGTLVWVFSTVVPDNAAWQLALSDPAGKLTPLAPPPGLYEAPRASPDGTRVAVGVADPKEAYVAIYDLDGKTAVRRLTFGGNSRYPVWSRDSQRVTFQSDREGDPAIFWQRADGTAPAERLTKPEKDTAHVPASWSPKDEHLLFTVIPAKEPIATGALWAYARASGTATPFGNVKAAGQSPMFSPDGRWVAYASRDPNDSSNGEGYIQPFPATGAQYQLPRVDATNTPANPFWSPDGTVLYFAPGPGRFASVSVTTQPAVALGNPTPMPRPFQGASPISPRAYDIMADGRLIGLIAPGQATDAAGTEQPEIRIVLNWAEELKRLVPVK